MNEAIRSAESGLVRIDAPHFCAGVVIRNGKVARAAPIVRWMIGRHATQVAWYCKSKKWKAELCRAT